MQSEKKIKERIHEIISDERLSYPAADIFSNAPLALIQLAMETELHSLEKVLEIPLTNFHKLRKKK